LEAVFIKIMGMFGTELNGIPKKEIIPHEVNAQNGK
jgi:hypothetical protein